MALCGDVAARLHSLPQRGPVQDDQRPQHREHRPDHPGAHQEAADPGMDGEDVIRS